MKIIYIIIECKYDTINTDSTLIKDLMTNMFCFIQGFEDCLYPIPDEDINFAYSQIQVPNRSGCPLFDARAFAFFHENGWVEARNWQEALQQYFRLVEMNI